MGIAQRNHKFIFFNGYLSSLWDRFATCKLHKTINIKWYTHLQILIGGYFAYENLTIIIFKVHFAYNLV